MNKIISKIKSLFDSESPGFKAGREAYRYWATKAHACNNNPFDPADTNYEDYYDGIVHEEDKRRKRKG